MSARYYAQRRLNPYRGVVQYVEVGDGEARSLDGVTWHLRADDGQGWVRPVGVWVEGRGLVAGVGARHPELLAALQGRPALPFPLIDSVELWLLDKESGRPLALLDAQAPSRHHHGLAELAWLPFALTYRGYHSAALAERLPAGAGAPRHRDFLERQVNGRARPYAGAQWFRRRPDGAGEGLTGYRLAPAWQGRHLGGAEFPELLVTDAWNSRLEKSAIHDYHAWLSPFLLCWPGLTDATRAELELAAWRRPRWLAQVYRLLPKVIDRAGLNAALVAARLQEAANAEEDGFG
ncbi:hypothetical protein EZJ19_08095 [Parasulfuritortus cantonensis]|uniref:Uncharacterized protein n=1 Tax=Parasulfuritortus cantonensis TaxID=2528202 RepID=A0A4R1BDA8_9PROT|nr:hypothetical protein [Parasulfuritortus cantonensis]TCJ15014.1 hypothetical protein EZJ19_08095 [Parasulfuritortus cantonensis]